MGRNKSLRISLVTAEFNMSITTDFGEGEEPTKEERAKRLGAILEKFATLSPELQEKIIDFADEIEQMVEKKEGQHPRD